MGSIFKPSVTTVQAPSQSQTSYDIPEYFKEIQERTLRRGEQEFSKPYQAYQGQRIAQLDPYEIQAGNIYQNQIVPQSGQLAAIGQQIANASARTYDTATAKAYANPYEDQSYFRCFKRFKRSLWTKSEINGCFSNRCWSFWWI